MIYNLQEYNYSEINPFSKSYTSYQDVKHKVLVGVPFRDSGDRLPGFIELAKYFKKNFPNFHFLYFNNDGPEFNLSGSRNLAIRYASENNYDVVILNDSDVFLNKDVIVNAVNYSYETNEITIPFNIVIHLDKTGTHMFREKNSKCMAHINRLSVGADGPDAAYRPCGGVIVGPPKTFVDAGMYDQNYVGWGHEDVDFHLAYEKKYGKKFNRINSTGIALFSRGSKRGTHNDEYYYNKNKHLFG